MSEPPRVTGLTCTECYRPVAVIEDESEETVVFRCPQCGHVWTVVRNDRVTEGELDDED